VTSGVTSGVSEDAPPQPRKAPDGPGPLDGVTVVEVGMWVAGPAVGAVLADWGADVIKVEPLAGDPMRGLEGIASAGGPALPANPTFDVTNRGKRSVAVDLKSPEARAIVEALVDRADVFVTNLRIPALERLGLDHETLLARRPELVYGLLTAYGTDGPDRDNPGYDIGAYWARSGIAHSLTVPGSTPPFQRGAMGDRTAGAALAGGIAAALFARTRTGKGQLVTESLFRWGVYTLASDLSMTLQLGMPIATAQRESMASPTVNCYRAGDDRWFWLIGLERSRHWPPLAEAVGHPEWLDDERFATSEARQRNAAELIAELDRIFARADRDHWFARFAECGVWHERINAVPDLLEDRQLVPSGALVEVDDNGFAATFVNTPVDFGMPAGPRGLAPDVGQDTDEVLSEAGLAPDHIARLREAGVVA
jgi:crotonobetainyl-CoA:carnitine CoA-transferase CaiB-like acyl-CoA transferase